MTEMMIAILAVTNLLTLLLVYREKQDVLERVSRELEASKPQPPPQPVYVKDRSRI